MRGFAVVLFTMILFSSSTTADQQEEYLRIPISMETLAQIEWQQLHHEDPTIEISGKECDIYRVSIETPPYVYIDPSCI